jgi:hypothetical protein
MYYLHDGAPVYFIRSITQYLNGQFFNRLFDGGDPQNWPLRSPDFSTLDFHVWDYIKFMLYESVVDITDETLQ